jgi:hypothetical protein
MKLALMFTTEKQYDSAEKVASIIDQSGLPAAQNIIGIDPEWDESQAARKAINAAGAQLHVYHQGPGMEEFGESSDNWEKNLKGMLLEHREATSFEIDNIDQLGDGLLDWIVELQKWQRTAGFPGKLVLKNPNPFQFRKIKVSDRVDQSLISPFIIIETKKGGLPDTDVAAIMKVASSFGMTSALTINTYDYRTLKPVVHDAVVA